MLSAFCVRQAHDTDMIGLGSPRVWVVVGVTIATWGITTLFVSWQLRNRAHAAEVVTKCVRDLADYAARPEEFRPRPPSSFLNSGNALAKRDINTKVTPRPGSMVQNLWELGALNSGGVPDSS